MLPAQAEAKERGPLPNGERWRPKHLTVNRFLRMIRNIDDDGGQKLAQSG